MMLYRSLKRDILLTELNLTPQKRKEVAEFLAWNIRPENRDYLYHHYLDNCATRVRDVIDKATDGQLHEAASVPADLTFRGHTRRHTQRNPYIDVLLATWMNDEIDAPIEAWDEMFLPSELLEQVDALQYVDERGEKVPLVKRTTVVFDADRPQPPQSPNTAWPWTMLFGIAFGAVGFLAARKYETTAKSKWRRLLGAQHFMAGLLFGLPGLVIVLFPFTDHTVTFWNENILLTNVFTFLALPLSFSIMRGKQWAMGIMRVSWYALAVTSLVAVVAKLLPGFDQANGLVLAMFLPFNVLMAAAMHRFTTPPARGSLEPIADGIWSVTSQRRFLDIRLGSRMTVVRLRDGGLWLHSPIHLDDALARELDELGEVRYLVGPNRLHHMHLGEWAARYPDAKLYAAPGLEKKRPDLEFAAVLGDEAEPAWAGMLEQHVVKGAPLLSEVVFYHPPSSTLITCDLVVNLRSSDHLPTRLYFKLTGVENRFTVEALVKAGLKDNAAGRASIDRILEWDFQRITMCHGEILEGDGQAKLREAFQFLG